MEIPLDKFNQRLSDVSGLFELLTIPGHASDDVADVFLRDLLPGLKHQSTP